MADIAIRKETAAAPQAPSLTRENAPFRLMRDMLRWDPFNNVSSLLRLDPFQEMAPVLADWSATFAPDFEVKETKDAYLFKADVPGVKETDIEVTLTGNRLTIGGSRNEEQVENTDTYYSCERKYGTFSRSYTLPDGADAEHIHADLKAGVLTIAVPKRPEVLAKKIAVKALPTKA